jgi:predicted Zn-dependent peptidase
MDRLRTELKAVYGISAMVEVVNFGQSSFSLETEVESKFIPLIIKEVLKQVVSLKKKLIGEAEFSRVKNKIIMANRLIPLSIEPERYASQYSDHVLWDEKVVTYQDKLSSFEKITPVDVQKFVENNLVRWDNLSIAYCGGQDCSEKIKKIIRGIRIV